MKTGARAVRTSEAVQRSTPSTKPRQKQVGPGFSPDNLVRFVRPSKSNLWNYLTVRAKARTHLWASRSICIQCFWAVEEATVGQPLQPVSTTVVFGTETGEAQVLLSAAPAYWNMAITGAWSEGFSPLRSSRSISTETHRLASGPVTRMWSMRMPQPRWNAPMR
jgi:hypothetical protein